MLFDLVLLFGLCKFSNSFVMKCKNGFWSSGSLPPCVKLSKKNSCFSSDILVLQKKQRKKAKTPPKIIPNLPKIHFPIPFPSHFVTSLQKPEVRRGLQNSAGPALPAASSGAWDLFPLLWLHFSFLCTCPGDIEGFLWVTPISSVWNCHIWVVHSVRKPSDVGQCCSQFSWGTKN